MAVAGAGQALQLPVLFRIILSEIRAGPGGRRQRGHDHHAAVRAGAGRATLGTLFLSLAPGMGMRDALVTTLVVQVGGIAVTTLRSRPPRKIG